MALSPPLDFSNDIVGKDTNLVPIIIIGNVDESTDDWIFLSTNNITLEYGQIANSYNFKPLLLNIPSLKEKIDLEKRAYNISAVTLDVNNFPYEGQRFSEIASETSLINKECRIFWVSPSVLTIGLYDKIAGWDPANHKSSDAFQIFTGFIRRYDHGHEKCRIIIEDKSQSLFHKDLPLAEDYLTGVNVPSKYKNKPIPTVYGFVDRSPVLMIDDSPITMKMCTNEDTIASKLYIYSDGHAQVQSVINIYSSSSLGRTKLFEYPIGTQVFVFQGTIITFLGSEKGDEAPVTPVTSNSVIVEQSRPFSAMDWKPLRQESLHWSSTDGWNPSGDGSRTFYGSYIKEESSYVKIYGSILKESDSDSTDWEREGGEPMYFMDWADPGDYPMAPDEKTFYQDIYDPDVGAESDKSEMKIVGAIAKTNIVNPGDEADTMATLQWSADIYLANICAGNPDGSNESWGGSNNGRVIDIRIGGGGHGDYVPGGVSSNTFGALSHTSNINTTDFNNMELVESFQKLGETVPTGGIGIDEIQTTDQLLVYCVFPSAMRGAVDLTLKNVQINKYSLVENMRSQDYYAMVHGSGWYLYDTDTYFTAPRVISKIVREKLDSSQPYYNTQVYSDWYYDFTLNEKINSKELIEQIASASPHIPRFDNEGKFMIHTIRLTYDDSDYIIKESEVIDFSFSRTKIEDVVSKIEFSYKWDYGAQSFSKHRSLDIRDFACANSSGNWETFSYYGLREPVDNNDGSSTHPDSTLVIDDQRGKYIRDDHTAEKFVCWMMSWYCNQHVIMKIKLPLSIGLKISIAETVRFEDLLEGIAPYGIDYTFTTTGIPTFQSFYPYFLVTETKKQIAYVEITCIQLHRLWAQEADNDPEQENGRMVYQ